MPNPVIQHKRPALPRAVLEANIHGVDVSTTVTATAHSSVAHPFLQVTKPQSSSFLIQTFSFSYDGVIHVDSYVSDI